MAWIGIGLGISEGVLFISVGSEVSPTQSVKILTHHNFSLTIVGIFIKRILCVRPSVRVCVTFLKRAAHHTGCFSLAFSMFYELIAYVFLFDAVFFRPRSIAKWVIAMVATFSKVLITRKQLHLEHFCKIHCSATFSMPARCYHF